MCGIIAEFNTQTTKKKTEQANEFVINQYQDQYKRGTEGFGIIRINNKGKIEVDRACEPTKFLIDLTLKKSEMIIAHHRTPTSTKNLRDQTHPMLVSNKMLKYDYLVVHNGVISNTEELHTKHLELGFDYTTEYQETSGYYTQLTKNKWNDSESLAIELALYIEKKIERIGITNNAAFIVLQIEKNSQKAKQVYFGKNGEYAALNMTKVKGKLRISSEGEGDSVEANKLYMFNPLDKSMYLSRKDIEFAVPVKVPEVKLPAVIATSTNLLTDNTKTVTAERIPADKEETEMVVIRNWATEEQIERASEIIEGEIVEKGYIENLKTEFIKEIEDSSSTAITHLIDDKLDEEIEKIIDLTTDLKSQLMVRKFSNLEEIDYVKQVSRIMRAMKEITEIADEKYREKAEEEVQEEVDEYNGTFGYNHRWKGLEDLSPEDKAMKDRRIPFNMY